MTDVSPSGFRSTRDIAATPERVWDVLTTPSALATWLGTDDASIDQRDTVMFELAGAEANGCSLTLSQTGGGLDVDGYAQAAAGWAGFVDVIERLAAAST